MARPLPIDPASRYSQGEQHAVVSKSQAEVHKDDRTSTPATLRLNGFATVWVHIGPLGQVSDERLARVPTQKFPRGISIPARTHTYRRPRHSAEWHDVCDTL